jgi:hypothetical protein
MKYFKDANNQITAYESDGSQDNFILAGLTAITQAEADEVVAILCPLIKQLLAEKP